ncbi:MAG: DUF1467 family protein [Hyphomicrobiaceae bacterium]
MDIVFAVAIYFVVWWIGLFAVLPFFARPQIESETGEVVPGTPESAPVYVRVGRIAAWNTLSATLVFAVIWAIIVFDPFDFGGIPDTLPR